MAQAETTGAPLAEFYGSTDNAGGTVLIPMRCEQCEKEVGEPKFPKLKKLRRICQSCLNRKIEIHKKWLQDWKDKEESKEAQEDSNRLNLDEYDLCSNSFPKKALQYASLRKVRLRSVDLKGADLSGAILTGASLEECDLRNATLWSTTFGGGANLFKAKLCQAMLIKGSVSV